MPFPGTGNDLEKIIVFRFPTEFLFYFCGGGNETRGIARAPRQFFGGNGMSRDLARGLDHFADRVPIPASKVVDEVVAFAQSIQCKQMSRDQVGDVNLITDARAIGRGIVRAVNLRFVTLTKRDAQD